MARLTVRAPAKINLYLHVTGRRADGYHTLNSLIAFAALADTVTVQTRAGGGFSVAVDGPFAVALDHVDDNLVLRAARTLAAHAGPDAGANIGLTKNIPVAAGLGGGSADAAAVLVALDRLWGLNRPDLADIGLSLGADVPVCLASVPALVGGVGEAVRALDPLPPMGLLLANPGLSVETRAVFTGLDAGQTRYGASAPAPAGPFNDASALIAALAQTGNDLDASARVIAPAIAEVLDAIGATDGCRLARMSGSGATCFGLYDDEQAAAAAVAAIGKNHPGWWLWSGGFGGRS